MSASPVTASAASVEIHREAGVLRVRMSGRFTLSAGLPRADALAPELDAAGPGARLVFEPAELEAWDSGLVSFVFAAASLASARGVAIDTSALPEGARRLLQLSLAVPARVDTRSSRRTTRSRRAWARWRCAPGAPRATRSSFLGETVSRLGALAARPRPLPPRGPDARLRVGGRGGARDRGPDQLPDRRRARVRGRGPAPAVRGHDLRGEPGRRSASRASWGR